MTETNLYDSIALADRIKLQCKSRNVQIKDVMDSANLSNGTLYNLRSGKMLKADSLAQNCRCPRLLHGLPHGAHC